jgi:hypothetical protein
MSLSPALIRETGRMTLDEGAFHNVAAASTTEQLNQKRARPVIPTGACGGLRVPWDPNQFPLNYLLPGNFYLLFVGGTDLKIMPDIAFCSSREANSINWAGLC